MFRTLVQIAPEFWRASIRHQHTEAVCSWDIFVGDAAAVLAAQPHAAADFIWQDPFSPDKNPAMWGVAWFHALRPHAADGAQLVTYSVARGVREALEHGGWKWEKIKTATKLKKHWLRARPVLFY